MTLEERLRKGESAESLAQEFSNQLNAALATINKEKDIDTDAKLTADSWNHFVHSYFVVHPIPEGTTEADYQMQATDVPALLNILIQTTGTVKKCATTLNNLKTTEKDFIDSLNKVNEKIKTYDKPKSKKDKEIVIDLRPFEDTVKAFFDMLNIK